jgi:hypothetical protein
MTVSELDIAISDALEQLRKTPRDAAFDYQSYIKTFRESAQKKAKAALAELNSPRSPFIPANP